MALKAEASRSRPAAATHPSWAALPGALEAAVFVAVTVSREHIPVGPRFPPGSAACMCLLAWLSETPRVPVNVAGGLAPQGEEVTKQQCHTL